MSARRGVLVVVLLIVVAMIMSAGGVALLLLLGGAPAPIPSNATLYLPVQAPWSEVAPIDLLSSFGGTPNTLRGIVATIRRAKADDRVRTLVIVPHADGAMWAQLQEVRDALLDFRKSGKPMTAYLEYGGAQEYYLASAADRVLMMPAGTLDLSGLATYEVFLRGALDKIGVLPDMLHIGDYKTASNTFTEKGFTAADREMTEWLNKDWYDQLVRAIASGRKRSEDDIRRAIDNGPYLADGARRAGLVDGLAYDDQIDDETPVKGTQRLDGDAYEKTPYVEPGASGPEIALLYAVGAIASGSSSFSGAGPIVGSDTFVQWIRKVRVDPAVRAIVVRIDSPGGSAIASDVIWRELMLAHDVKPVVVSMGDVAASGGYYIALPADAIVAEPGTETGSIGIVTGKFVIQGALDKLGVGTGAVSNGRFAQIDSPFKPFSPDERARVEEQMQAAYDIFLSHVAQARHSTPAKIDAIGRGRVWTGRQALDLGLVDELGGLDRAIQIARQRAKIDVRQGVSLIVYPPRRTVFDLFTNPMGTSMEAGAALLPRRPDLQLLDLAGSTLRLFRRGEPLAIMPNVFWN